MTSKQYIQAFMVKCEQRNLSASTIKAYQMALRHFHTFLQSLDGQITEENVTAYLDSIHTKFSQSTYNQKYAIICLFLDFLVDDNIIPYNPAARSSYKQVKQEYSAKTVEMKALTTMLNCAHQRTELFDGNEGRLYRAALRDVAVLELMFLTGIRVSEVCRLGVNDVDLEKRAIKITGTRNHERVILIGSESTISALTEYRNAFWPQMFAAGSFFVNRLGNPLSTRSVRETVKRYAHQANISQSFTPKNLRDSLATQMLEVGVSMSSLQQLLGHRSIDITKKYKQEESTPIITAPLYDLDSTKEKQAIVHLY